MSRAVNAVEVPAPRRLMYTPHEIGRMADTKYESVLADIRSGELEAVKRGQRWRIPVHAAKRYVRWPEDQPWPY